MIRNQQGNEYFLFTQDDHAQMAGAMARQWGNSRFARPARANEVIDAISMHDSGWPLHDRQPTLDRAGLPLHVFDAPVELAVTVWAESVRLAQARSAYTGLLVSLHTFALSALAYGHLSDPDPARKHALDLFKLNKFQQLQIETQEHLRQSLGMQTDTALQLGLADPGSGADEDALRANYFLLRAMDQMSLAALCGGRPITTVSEVIPKPGATAVDFRVGYPAPFTLTLFPWPFAVDSVEYAIPFRRVPARVYSSADSFREAYLKAPEESQVVRVTRSYS